MPYLTTNEETKECKSCLRTKPITDFSPRATCRQGVNSRCRECQRAYDREYRRAYYLKNREAVSRKNRAWFAANPETAREYGRKKYHKNLEKSRAQCRESYRRNYQRPAVKLRNRLKLHLHRLVSLEKPVASAAIGCDGHAIRAHLELLFIEGMSWDNMGEWEIDHFYPIAAIGENPSALDVSAVFNYRNLRPVWRFANRSKRAVVLPEALALFEAIKDLIRAGKQ